jgi:hypothetical protein
VPRVVSPYRHGASACHCHWSAPPGQLIEQTLDVSDYASTIGIKHKEFGERIGAGETASFVADAVATVASTPSSITIAAADKITGGRFAHWIGLK